MARGIAHREWAIHREDYRSDFGNVDEAAFRAAVEQEMALAVHVMERLGVGIVAVPVRRRGPSGTWYTDRYVFQTASVPAAREVDQTDEAADLEAALDGEPDALTVE